MTSDKISAAVRGNKTCPICLNNIVYDRSSSSSSLAAAAAAVITVCMHAFCYYCINKWSRIKRNCPLCNVGFDSLFVDIDLCSGRFCTKKLPDPKSDGVRFESTANYRDRFAAERVIRRSRFERNNVNSRTRPLPWRRSFGRPGTVTPEAVAERVLRWRASIYNRRLQAVPTSSGHHTRQSISQSNIAKERILERIEPWIRRELHAILEDPDPSIILHVVSSLFITSLEDKHKDPLRDVGDEESYLAPLRPFLHDLTALFWHELRHFAESSLTKESYDAVVEYKQMDQMQFNRAVSEDHS